MQGRKRKQPVAWEGVDLVQHAKLYEAYSDLHRVAQKTRIPIDAPIVTVVGNQTDGKSALIEALMGFQFNHVGGGTKTRRPVAIEMVYDASAEAPQCFLATADGDKKMTLDELKEYIESENVRLGNEGRFDATDIIVQIRYKHCPNLMIIDTPGLMSIPDSDDNHSLRQASQQVEEIVRQKISQPESINLCLEDNSDWVNATTRRVVLDFDTRMAQFATSADVVAFLHPSTEQLSGGSMLGHAPFFTSVPSGRVGTDGESVFTSAEEFQAKVKEQEQRDYSSVEAKLRRALTADERCHIGVSNVRKFLETELLRRYQEHIPAITNIVNGKIKEMNRETRDIEAAQKCLDAHQVKDHVRRIVLRVLQQLAHLLSGDASFPAYESYGQSLQEEWEQVGKLQCEPGFELHGDWKKVVDDKFGEDQLYGGAQYFRALDEFREFVSRIQCPSISKIEMHNKCGLGTRTDAPNILSVAAQLAADKAERAFEQLLPQLGERVKHVLSRVMQLSCTSTNGPMSPTGDPAFLAMDQNTLECIQDHYTQFIEDCEAKARASALEDLKSRTHFVTLGHHGDALHGSLQCVVDDKDTNKQPAKASASNGSNGHKAQAGPMLSQPRGQVVQQSVVATTREGFTSKHDPLLASLECGCKTVTQSDSFGSCPGRLRRSATASPATPFVAHNRGQVVQQSVPDLAHSLFRQIREGFISDTMRKFNYHLLRQLQDAYGLNEYLQSRMEQEEVGALCNTEEVKQDLERDYKRDSLN